MTEIDINPIRMAKLLELEPLSESEELSPEQNFLICSLVQIFFSIVFINISYGIFRICLSLKK